MRPGWAEAHRAALLDVAMQRIAFRRYSCGYKEESCGRRNGTREERRGSFKKLGRASHVRKVFAPPCDFEPSEE